MTEKDQSHWRRVREVFNTAIDADSMERSAIVRELCGGDAPLLTDVRQLLALRSQTGLVLDHSPLSLSASRYRPGQWIGGRYRIVRFIASGGMGEVYEAEGGIALKFVRRDPQGSRGHAEARFLREVKMARQIDPHPNVCRVFDLGEHEGQVFCAMELLSGETLAEKLKRDGRMTPEQALPLALQMCDGLDAAHRAGVVHRDLKPSNIFLTQDRAVIIDFGLADAAAPNTEQSLTATGVVIGTLAYMAPEQLEEGRSSPAADLYSLGVIFYEMLTGEKPHDAKSPFRLAAQKARESHQAPSSSGVSTMPAIWREVVTRSLKPRPESRFPNPLAMKRALERGRPSAGFVFRQKRVWIPAALIGLVAFGWAGWTEARKDHVPPLEASRLYQQAYEAMTEAAPMRAVAALQQSIALDPNFLNARSLLAVAQAETDQADLAKDALLQAIAARDRRWFVGKGESQALRAANAAVVRDFTGAAEQYRQLALLPGNQDFATLSEARMLRQAGRFDAATAVLRQSSIPAARVELAALLCRKRDYEAAAAQFKQAEAAYQEKGNTEGLTDVWIARALSRVQETEDDKRDLTRAMEASVKTGNRYAYLTAKAKMASLFERERSYDQMIATAHQVAEEAQHEGMLAIAARAMEREGYAYHSLRDLPKALLLLRQSVVLAERSKSNALIASNRLSLGETLNSMGQRDEAVSVMDPAVAWYRKDGGTDLLPLILIKWGTALFASKRQDEAPKAFEEALQLAQRNDQLMFQSMALQRLASVYGQSDLLKSAEYLEKALSFGDRMLVTDFYFKAASISNELGRFDHARELIEKGRREALSTTQGATQRMLLERASEILSVVAFFEGRCADAVALGRGLNLANDVVREGRVRRAEACAVGGGGLDSSLSWFEAKIAEAGSSERTHHLSRLASDVALRASHWQEAKRFANQAIEASRATHDRNAEMQATIELRAAEAKLGNRAEADRLTGVVLALADPLGFRPPEKFGGRKDLLFLWRMGNNH